METIVTSPSKKVIIGPGRPFVVIGERINPTGRKLLGKEMAAGNFDRVRNDAIAQVQAGAHMLDVNAGIPMADEPAVMAEAIRIVQSVVDVPLAIDSSVVAALASGLEAYQGKALVNSVTGEAERLESVLPLVAEHGAAVIGIANDETGISHDPDVRFAVAKRIVERAESFGISREDVIIDPLAMPVGAVPGAGATFIQLVATHPRRAGGQHDLWRIEYIVWLAGTAVSQRCFSRHDYRRRHDLRHHQSTRSRNDESDFGSRRPSRS